MSSPAPLSAARERVVRLLTDRYADDTLTVEEFEAELDRLHAITDPAELDRMADGLTTGARPTTARPADVPARHSPRPRAPATGSAGNAGRSSRPACPAPGASWR